MRPKRLPERTLEETVEAFPTLRQSLLGRVDNCSLSARFELEGYPITTGPQARGIIFHRTAAEILRTLWRTGERTIPQAEALEIMYEVAAQRDVPPEEIVVVPAKERRTLRIAVLALAGLPLDTSRLIDVERRLFSTITYRLEDGTPVERQISGQPDALLADPPNGAIVLDWKTAPSAPAAAPNGNQEHWTGDAAHVSYEGYWQQRFYALLVLDNFPSVERVTLREYYVLPREARPATVPREALEHIRREITIVAETLDRGLMGGSKSRFWSPSPGHHCGYCRRPLACPVELDARQSQGGITSEAQASRAAAEFILIDRVRPDLREALKSWHEITGQPIPVKSAKGRAELRWGADAAGRRRFGMHVPATSDRGPEDPNLAEAFKAAAERARASRG